MSDFRKELQVTINRCSMENGSNTPDFILAAYLMACLEAYDNAVTLRAIWYGGNDKSVPQQPPAL